MGHVELEEAGAVAVGCCNGFNGTAAGGGEALGEVELFGDGGKRDLAGGAADIVYADGSETDRSGDCKGEKGGLWKVWEERAGKAWKLKPMKLKERKEKKKEG